MPLINSDKGDQSISSKTPSLDIVVRYREIEPELFLIFSEVKFKANVCFRHVYDAAQPSDYYCLSLRIDHYAKINNSLANGICYTDNSWLIFKPDAKVDHHHFQGTTGKYISLYFTPAWIQRNMKVALPAEKEMLDLFFNSGSDHLICPNLDARAVYNINNLRKLLRFEVMDQDHLEKLKEEAHKFLSCFASKMSSEKITARHFNVSNHERISLLKAERLMEKHINKKFPGLKSIAQESGFSGTKLKECFRVVYDKSVFQYFRGMQMEKAKELISVTDMQIRQVARKLGYENPGKFAAAFRTHHAIPPSQIRRST